VCLLGPYTACSWEVLKFDEDILKMIQNRLEKTQALGGKPAPYEKQLLLHVSNVLNISTLKKVIHCRPRLSSHTYVILILVRNVGGGVQNGKSQSEG